MSRADPDPRPGEASVFIPAPRAKVSGEEPEWAIKLAPGAASCIKAESQARG